MERDEVASLLRQLVKGNKTIIKLLRQLLVAQGVDEEKQDRGDLDSKIMLSPSDVAYLLGIHVNTVRRWVDKGKLKALRITSRGDRRFRREDIERFLKERQRSDERR
jgi:excisionase family DNA binding protein